MYGRCCEQTSRCVVPRWRRSGRKGEGGGVCGGALHILAIAQWLSYSWRKICCGGLFHNKRHMTCLAPPPVIIMALQTAKKLRDQEADGASWVVRQHRMADIRYSTGNTRLDEMSTLRCAPHVPLRCKEGMKASHCVGAQDTR